MPEQASLSQGQLFVGFVSASFGSTYGWSQYHLLIPISLTGAALVSWSDALSRAIAFPTETPVGVITALLGTPCLF
ncbi:iron chelate uptake ABC transporter family permease subunit [Vibrio lentus]|nr:iron chelate uptake ABC transporter family permease subunit [Vibrio lentus]